MGGVRAYRSWEPWPSRAGAMGEPPIPTHQHSDASMAAALRCIHPVYNPVYTPYTPPYTPRINLVHILAYNLYTISYTHPYPPPCTPCIHSCIHNDSMMPLVPLLRINRAFCRLLVRLHICTPTHTPTPKVGQVRQRPGSAGLPPLDWAMAATPKTSHVHGSWYFGSSLGSMPAASCHNA